MGHKRVFYDNLVVADPEIKIVDVEEDDNFVIIACDGFWDVLKFEEAIKYSLELLDDGKCAQYVSQKLCQLAVRMGSSDNVSLFFMCIQGGQLAALVIGSLCVLLRYSLNCFLSRGAQ